MLDIPGIPDAGGLEEDELDLLDRHGAVLHTMGHHQALAGTEFDDPVTEFHPEVAPMDQEKFVLDVVMMPDELPLDLDELDLLAVERGNDPG